MRLGHTQYTHRPERNRYEHDDSDACQHRRRMRYRYRPSGRCGRDMGRQHPSASDDASRGGHNVTPHP